MDKIHKLLPIQQRDLRSPVVLAFNVLTNHYLAFGTSHYKSLTKIISRYNQVDKFYLLPNVTSVSMSVEQRGAQLAERLKELAARENIGGRVHLVTHSFCGVDARAAISLYGADANLVRSLTTVSSPHHGCRLVDNCAKYPARFQIELAEKAFEAVGLSQGSVQEFTSGNLTDFNRVAEDVSDVDYYSIGAYKQRL